MTIAKRARPILFSGPMVCAILEGRKSQTRRVVKPQPPAECGIHYMIGNESWLPVEKRGPLRHSWEAWGGPLYESRPAGHMCGNHAVRCPYGVPGDRLWVRESWYSPPRPLNDCLGYVADGDYPHGMAYRVRPSIHMPRCASRITLEITGVRVERLQDISEADCIAEGVETLGRDIGREAPYDAAKLKYASLWESINGPGSWDANPFVWVIEFKRLNP